MDQRLYIEGQKKLVGEVVIGGAKNSAVAIIPALILSDAPCTVRNLPKIDDVKNLKELLDLIGAETTLDENGVLTTDTSKGLRTDVNFDLAKK